PRYRGIEAGDYRLLVIEAGEHILRGVHPELAERARKDLWQEGIEIHTGTRVTRVRPGSIEVNGTHEIPVALTVWAAGVMGHPALASVPLQKDRLGRLLVTRYLQTVDHREIYGAGDAMAIEG